MTIPSPSPASAQHFLFSGSFAGESFQQFARHRATRLNLDLEVGEADDAAVALSVTGDSNLVDMFEMAMSLGPHDCIVLDVRRTG